MVLQGRWTVHAEERCMHDVRDGGMCMCVCAGGSFRMPHTYHSYLLWRLLRANIATTRGKQVCA